MEQTERLIDYAFIAIDLNERAKRLGLDGLSDESLEEMADQLAFGHAEEILDDYESRLCVNVSWARDRIATLAKVQP